MKLRDFYKLTELNVAIAETIAEIAVLENSCGGGGGFDGMPHGSSRVRSVVEDNVLRLERLRKILERDKAERDRLQRFIDSIDDPHVRRIFRYKFEQGLSWTKVALKMGGRNSPEGLRQTARRYLEKHER